MTTYRRVNVSELAPGSILAAAVLDDNLTKLIDAGVSVDKHLIERLQAHGITEVVVENSPEVIVKHSPKPLPAEQHVLLKGGDVRKPVEYCSVCGTNICLEPPAPNLEASTWLCKKCGAIYFGSEEGRAHGQGAFRVDPAAHNLFVPSSPATIPLENVRGLVRRAPRRRRRRPASRGRFPPRRPRRRVARAPARRGAPNPRRGSSGLAN